MGPGRGKAALACALGGLVLTLPLLGCGAEEHANDPRPPIPVEVTVSLAENQVSVQPSEVGSGDGDRQAISQNEGVESPEFDPDSPLNVVFTVANLTPVDTQLEIEGPKQATSELIVGRGTTRFEVALPSGDYSIGAADLPNAAEASFSVGPERVSSQNDLLLP
jgi:hypothetical protein